MKGVIDLASEKGCLELKRRGYIQKGIVLTQSGHLKECKIYLAEYYVVQSHRMERIGSIAIGTYLNAIEYEFNDSEPFIPFFDRYDSYYNSIALQGFLGYENFAYYKICERANEYLGDKAKYINYSLFNKNIRRFMCYSGRFPDALWNELT